MDNKHYLQSSSEADGSNHNSGTSLVIKWISLSPLSYLRAGSTKLKVVSFLFGLTLSFFIVASYILTWDKTGILITPAPSPLRPSLDMRSLLRNILFKLDYTPRRVPDEREVIGSDPEVSRVPLVDFLLLRMILLGLVGIGSVNDIIIHIIY